MSFYDRWHTAPCIRCHHPGHSASRCPVHCDPLNPCEKCEDLELAGAEVKPRLVVRRYE